MRRVSVITAFLLFLTVPLLAQRGGGHAGGFGGGHAGGFGGARAAGFGGHVSGGHIAGSRFAGGTHASFSRGFNSSRFSSRSFQHDRFRFRNCFGFACRGRYGYNWWGYPGWGWGYYDPYLWGWWDNNSSYDDQGYDNGSAYADQLTAENAALRNMLRQEAADHDLDAYARRPAPGPLPSAQPDEDKSAPLPPTVLVYRDQHKEEVTNYAIVGQTLWNFTPQRKQRIPLADLDIPATVKANDDRGVTFRVPGANEGQ